MNETNPSTQIKKADTTEKPMEFVPYGAQDPIKLTISMIQNLIAVPTRSGKTCSQKDAMKFMMLCQAQRLNPFAGDAYLIGYDNSDGVATFSLITAHSALLKRAELHPKYEGMDSGVVVLNEENGQFFERETDFHLPDENVVGGWAKVYCKDRRPTYRRVRMARFNKGRAQWKEDAAGMIVKCAEADALRSTFPTLLGGLYCREEMDLPTSMTRENDLSALSAQFSDKQPQVAAPLPEPKPTPADADDHPDLAPATEGGPVKPVKTTAKKELEAMVLAEGFTFDQFRKWAHDTGNLDFDSVPSFEEVPEEVAKRLLRSKTGLIRALEQIRQSESK